MPELPDINRFLRPRTTIDLGLIRDVTNPISKMAKLGTSIISDAYEAGEDDSTRFTDIGDIPIKTVQSMSQASDAAVTSRTPTPPLTMEPRPSSSKLVPADYVLVSQ